MSKTSKSTPAANGPTLHSLQPIVDRVPGLTVVERRGGLVIDVAIDAARASIALQGAQVLSWAPAGHDDVLWCSPLSPLGGGKAIRGGIPLCWPWFGPNADDSAKPQHGFARNITWDLVDVTDLDNDDGHLVLTFGLPAEAPMRTLFPHAAQALLFVDIGRTLTIRLETENIGNTSFTITDALHTYVRVGDVSRVRIDGLDGATYRDNAAGGRITHQDGPLTVSKETVALFDIAPAVANIVDPVLKRCISVMREPDSRSTIVWNPGATAAAMADIPKGGEAGFVCVESGDIGAAAITLEPGDCHACGVTYAVARV